MIQESNRQNAYNDVFRTLKSNYLRRVQNAYTEISAILNDRKIMTRDDYVAIHQLVHTLAGSGSIFDFPTVSESAQHIDAFLGNYLKSAESQGLMGTERTKTFRTMLKNLADVCQQVIFSAENTGNQAETVLAPMPEGETDKYRVLVVDDDSDLSKLIASKLAEKDIQAIFCTNGEDAMNLVARTRPDLIVLDIMLPGMSGHDILKKLKQEPAFTLIPIIMLTVSKDDRDVAASLQSGAIDYIVKPFDTEQLIDRIESILEASQKTIVIADNDPMILQLLRTKFAYEGFRVYTATDGQKALDMVARHQPDLLILDIIMPVLDGTAVVHRMRKIPKTSKIPVLIMSTRSETEDIAEGIESGAQDYITKPFLTDDLFGRGLRLIERSVS